MADAKASTKYTWATSAWFTLPSIKDRINAPSDRDLEIVVDGFSIDIKIVIQKAAVPVFLALAQVAVKNKEVLFVCSDKSLNCHRLWFGDPNETKFANPVNWIAVFDETTGVLKSAVGINNTVGISLA